MDYENMKVVDLKVLAKECGLRGYSRLKKAELITFLQPCTRPLSWEPIDDRPIPASSPALRTRPPPSPPPRQPELRPGLPAKA